MIKTINIFLKNTAFWVTAIMLFIFPCLLLVILVDVPKVIFKHAYKLFSFLSMRSTDFVEALGAAHRKIYKFWKAD